MSRLPAVDSSPESPTWNPEENAAAIRAECAGNALGLAMAFLGSLTNIRFALAFRASICHAGQIMAKKAVPLYKQKPTPPLGEWLRQLRHEKGLALREVAAAADMDPAHLSKAELGQRLPTAEQVAKLANFLRVDATLMEAKRVAEKVMQEITASSAGAEALNILREEPMDYQARK